MAPERETATEVRKPGDCRLNPNRPSPFYIEVMRKTLLLVALCATANVGAAAQASFQVAISVRGLDSAGRAVEGAEVLVFSGLTTILQRRMTDTAGQATLLVEKDAGLATGFNVVARKIGYVRADRFISADRDRVSLQLSLRQTTQILSAVTVTTGPPINPNYYIDADAILASPRPLESGVDVVEKLRPQMIWGNSGPPLRGTPICEKLSAVFVNGVLVRGAPPEAIQRSTGRLANPSAVYSGVPKNVKMSEAAAATNAYVAEQVAKRSTYRVTGMPGAILTAIRPEHISEMRLNDCFQGGARVNRGTMALFIGLKPGIAYSPAEWLLGRPATSRQAAPRVCAGVQIASTS
jgi:hypothetical protein